MIPNKCQPSVHGTSFSYRMRSASTRDPVLATACAGCDDGPVLTCILRRQMFAPHRVYTVCCPTVPLHGNAGNMPSSHVVMYIPDFPCMKWLVTMVTMVTECSHLGYASWDAFWRQIYCPIGVLAEWSNA